MWYQRRRTSDCGMDAAQFRWERSRQDRIEPIQASVQSLRDELREWRRANQEMYTHCRSDRLVKKVEETDVGKKTDLMRSHVDKSFDLDLALTMDKGAHVAAGESSSEIAPSIINKDESSYLGGGAGPAFLIVPFDVKEEADLVPFHVEEKIVEEKADFVRVQPNHCQRIGKHLPCNRQLHNTSHLRRGQQSTRSCSLTHSCVVVASIIGGRRYMIDWIHRFRFLKLHSSNFTFKGSLVCSVSSVSPCVCWNAYLYGNYAIQWVCLNSWRLCDLIWSWDIGGLGMLLIRSIDSCLGVNDTGLALKGLYTTVSEGTESIKGWFYISELKIDEYVVAHEQDRSNMIQLHFQNKKLLACLDFTKRFQLYAKLEGQDGCVTMVHFNSSGLTLISGSDDREIRLWGWEAKVKRFLYHSCHTNNVFQALVMPIWDDRSLLPAVVEGEVRVGYILENGSVETKGLAKHKARAHKLAIEHGNSHIFYSYREDGLVQHHDLRSHLSVKLSFLSFEEKERSHIKWAMWLRVAMYLVQALEHYNSKGRSLYHGLNMYILLFDLKGDSRISYFRLVKNSRDGKSYSTNLIFTPLEYLQTDGKITESVVYSFDILLFDLLSGKHTPPNLALDLIHEKNFLLLMDSCLEGDFFNVDSTELIRLATPCLQFEPRERPSMIYVLAALASLEKETDVPSHVLMSFPPFTNETECQRSQLFVQKRLPGPATLAKRKLEVEVLGPKKTELRRKLSSSVRSQPENFVDKRWVAFLTEQLFVLEVGKVLLMDNLKKKDTELQALRYTCAQTSPIVEHLKIEKEVSGKMCFMSSETASSDLQNAKNSSAYSWPSTLVPEDKNSKSKRSQSPTCASLGALDLSLMDDFAGMNMLGLVPILKVAAKVIGASLGQSLGFLLLQKFLSIVTFERALPQKLPYHFVI